MSKTITTECLECNKEFSTTAMKCIGEVFSCPHCGHEHEADYDEVNDTWFSNHKLKFG
jgi:transposase